ncbi:MAG: transcription antitermination factor NusB [Clostridia bacterium]|nr:transcription antitermination factor NusB [Clostridia bacterium]
MRTKAREVVFQIVFASRFDGADNGLKQALYKKEKLTADDIQYAEKVIAAIKENGEELSEIIDKRSVAFPESRLFPSDKSILLVALAEIKYLPDIPQAVSVNEAANIASKYSSPKSASFVSGILSEVKKD